MPPGAAAPRPATFDGPCPHALGWVRVPAFTLPTVSLAVGAHMLGGGRAPDGATLALLFGGVALVSAGVSRRRRRLPGLVAGVALVQVAVHVALLGHHDPAIGAPSPPMLAAHAAATIALAWWLTKGESALWRRVAERGAALRRLLTVVAVGVQALAQAVASPVVRPSQALALLVPRRRGPPARV